MQVTINLDHATLDNLGITTEQFEQAAVAALSNLTHPASGASIYFNDVRVTAAAGFPEVHADAADPTSAAMVTELRKSAKDLAAEMCQVIAALGMDITRIEIGDVIAEIKRLQEPMPRWAIDGAIARGRAGESNSLPEGHWLHEYYEIGRQLASVQQPSC